MVKELEAEVDVMRFEEKMKEKMTRERKDLEEEETLFNNILKGSEEKRERERTLNSIRDSKGKDEKCRERYKGVRSREKKSKYNV